MKKIKLTRNLFALVDDEDYEEVSKHKWHAMKVKNRFYASGYLKVEKNKYTHPLLHRFIMKAEKNQQVDHIDGNCLNCTRENLRFVTDSQNQQNRGKHKDNTSGYKGVDWMKSRSAWRARICCNRKNIHIGLFDNPVDAAKAYDKKAIELHGNYARLNFKQ